MSDNNDLLPKRDPRGLGNAIWLQIEDGDTVTCWPLGETYKKRRVWAGSRYVDYNPEEHDKLGLKPVVKEAGNIAVRDAEGHISCRVIEKGPRFWGNFEKRWKRFGVRWYEVERDGAGSDTVHTITKGDAFTPEEQAQIKALELFDLKALDKSGETNGADPDFPFGANAE